MSNSSKKVNLAAGEVENPYIVDLGHGKSMTLQHIPVPTEEADEVEAEFVPNAEDAHIPTPRKKRTPKAEKVVKEKGKRGRKSNPDSARQARLKAQAEVIANGGVVKRGRKSNPDSASAQRKARLEQMRNEGITVKRGRPANPNKVVKAKKQRVKSESKVKPMIRIKLDNTNSVCVKGVTYVTALKVEKMNEDQLGMMDMKSSLNHPKFGKMYKMKA